MEWGGEKVWLLCKYWEETTDQRVDPTFYFNTSLLRNFRVTLIFPLHCYFVLQKVFKVQKKDYLKWKYSNISICLYTSSEREAVL